MNLSSKDLKDIVPNPAVIVSELDKRVIGQTSAKKALANLSLVRALIRLQRSGYLESIDKLDKTNLLLIGPTGCGKTSLINALSEILDIPIGIFDVTSVTSSGYYGRDVEDILNDYVIKVANHVTYNYSRLIKNIEYQDLYGLNKEVLISEMVETGIIFIDEIDKISMDYSHSKKNDIKTDGVQNELLKLLEGNYINFSGKRSVYEKLIMPGVDVSKISFICAGAFSGLEDVVLRRLKLNKGIGFNSTIIENDIDKLNNLATIEDLIAYGLKPELLGRISGKYVLSSLNKQSLLDILNSPYNPIISHYNAIFSSFGIDLEFTSDAKTLIVEKVLELKTGARGISTIITNILENYVLNIFNQDSTKFIINKEIIE